MNPPLKGHPVTAVDCDPEWIAVRREIIQREGRAVRGGTDRPTIEVATLNYGHPWAVLTLPNDATQFVSAEDRDAVLQQLQLPSP